MRLQRMKVISPLLLIAMAVILGGCDAPAQRGADTTEQATSPENKEEDMSELKPPSADSVLYFIYQRDGDGAVSYKIDGGATVSYWYGHEFDLDGKHYFTGFGAKTQGEGPDGDDGMMDPEHVAISQATFTRVEKDGKQAWSKPDTDGYVGEFGRLGRADEVDTSRKAHGYATDDGRYVLAVPTRDFMNGEEVQSFAMFLFDPDGKDALSFRQWGYVGSVRVGGDNQAACSDGHVMPCTASTGDLAFERASDGGLPALKVTPSGNTNAGPGKVRTLGPADAVTYRFDANAERYTP
ncbi:hypothetical protein FB548_0768 [Pseudoxanthomonas sp. 3HH-4]|uniref:hypothetical protein n=1 Tax=Pseudoxanthomonas sp. 3HH-4 TaxID=1690214 RepID=UPI00115434D2|nr:hypothetical protein [Pseudoxanthomonas sp. 3HH-4]TQM17385.1 hypothetical protein FB548_0768 [Pseudoxanthomonas sp. 3HH-4]